MAIEGPIKELGLMDLFQLLSLSRKSGILTLDTSENVGKIVFHQGMVVSAELQKGKEKIGEMLLKAGRIKEERINEILKEQESSEQKRKFGIILIEKGLLPKGELLRFLQLQLEDTIYNLLKWREGYFKFEEEEIKVEEEIPLAISPENIIMEVSRRLDEWAKIEQKIPSLEIVPALSPESESASRRLDLKPEEWIILSNIDGKKTIAEISKACAKREFDTAKIVYGLVITGLLEIVGGMVKEEKEEKKGIDHLMAGKEFLEKGMLLKAEEELQKALKIESPSPLVHFYLGELYYQQEAYEEAIIEYKLAANDESVMPSVNYCLGFAYGKIGRLDLAVERWEKFLSLVPEGEVTSSIREVVRTAVEWEKSLSRKKKIFTLLDSKQLTGFTKEWKTGRQEKQEEKPLGELTKETKDG
ncbi:MAG: DUF4388 domain-containing protein [Candidatus Edwardsbacteria bacterium]